MLAFFVVLLGAYTRLDSAGLGCPDWPGCYGKLLLPRSQSDLSQAQQNFPNQTLHPEKAWTEMIHRYFAALLGVLILGLAIWAPFRRVKFSEQPLLLPTVLVLLVCFQAWLGKLTVGLKLLPLVVMGHLIGAMAIAILLWWLTLANKNPSPLPIARVKSIRPWAILGFTLIVLQILLGAWTSTHYAALACTTFPSCHGSLSPNMAWRSAFNIFSPIGPNYEGGKLAMDARITIQMAHRYGAFLVATCLIPLAFCLLVFREYAGLRHLGILILIFLGIQCVLGILNIVWLLPTATAVAHSGIAALLLLTMTTLVYRLYDRRWGKLL